MFNATFSTISVISWRSVLLVVFSMKTTDTIIQLYCGGQFYWLRKPEEPEKATDLSHNAVHLALIEIRSHHISGVQPQVTVLIDCISTLCALQFV
jgi:hypothetical protein